MFPSRESLLGRNRGQSKTGSNTALGSLIGTMDSYRTKEPTRTGNQTVLGSITTKTELWMRIGQEPSRTERWLNNPS